MLIKQAKLAANGLFFSMLLWPFLAVNAATDMPLASNFYADARSAKTHNLPIAVLLVHKGVKSGLALKEQAIYPLLASGVFDDKVIFRELEVNTPGEIIDFYAQPLPNAEYQTLFNVTSLPAMVFLDAQGEFLTTPLFSGAYDFYGHYLKQKLNEAMIQLNNPTRF